MLGLNHGELFVVVFVFLVVVLAPYSGIAGRWLFTSFAPRKKP